MAEEDTRFPPKADQPTAEAQTFPTRKICPIRGKFIKFCDGEDLKSSSGGKDLD